MPLRPTGVLAAALSAALLLTGCGGDRADELTAAPSPTPTPSESPTAIEPDGAPTPTPEPTEEPLPTPAPDSADGRPATDPGDAAAAAGEGSGDATTGTGSASEPAPDPPVPAPATPTPPPTTAPAPPAAGGLDPCRLPEAQVRQITGSDLTLVGPSGGASFQLCTYGDPDQEASVDLAVIDLPALAEESGEPIDGELYIGDLVETIGEGDVGRLTGLGDGTAARLTYPYGSQVWAYVGDRAYGAHSSGLDDDDRYAEELLRAVLASVR